jgi:mono/diheme cytochrome c family protein
VKSTLIIIFLASIIVALSFFTKEKKKGDPVYIEASKQRSGNPEEGYNYLTTGDYLKSGIPFSFFQMGIGKSAEDLGREGINKDIPYSFNAVIAPNGEKIVSPNCLQCHSQEFNGALVIGMGNSLSDYTTDHSANARLLEKLLKNGSGNNLKYDAAKNFIQSIEAVSPYLVTETKGVNVADRLAALLVAHRDPKTFRWIDSSQLPIPEELIPTDVPPWWLLKKKHAMFYNGFGRGDFGRFLMASNLLTVTDTSEAAEVDKHFNDVLAYIYSLQPPKYPRPINTKLAEDGQLIFEASCSGCHGNYGKDADYPNLLIPEETIQTDSLLYSSNYSSPQFVDWFNQSWFTTGDHPAKLVPFKGYIAPPLDGIWATAPYLHNGSVPNLETLLNSKLRPKYWSRNFKNPQYDIDSPGWKYKEEAAPVNKDTYNTTLKGYSNTGHTFGDKLSNDERAALIEYLKTL